ncbi:nucleotidyl transferase AbiEii/AbiGii toxin family protein [Beggiatoa leptomitoformis]|uniref:Nucleotidyltransferase family protein n=1 Tax=Beggiatoa leptomitoformis TaxID=288004 RepID=A0A2N9YGG4_9GAMM|nr:nucleotidyl transferase AbiEii/AbiGii toxin family protein [Beggiatoa leptomitoformis]ALG68093.1 hypothetical protein AL038_10725 [Beggiatoa leptomitoformis]AUI69612.1 hypothetical protein BLE401_13545 [Beggiatoa leptomitoformis]
MHSQYQVLAHITQCLEQANIAYMLSGSVALSYYAQPRMTRDIDLVIEIQNDDVIKLAQQLGETYYFDEDMAHAAIAHESLFNILHQDSMIKIDCIVRKNHHYRQQEFLRRQHVTFNNLSLWIVSPEDLLLSKLDWLKDSRSEMQFKDIANLITSVPTLDWAYIHDWAQHLGIQHLLKGIHP